MLTFGFFSGIEFLNSYYTAALIPAVGALCGMGAAAAWHRRRQGTVRAALATVTAATVTAGIALVPGYVGVRPWIVASSVIVGLLAVGILLGSLRAGHDSAWNLSVGPALAAVAMLLGSFWASSVVVAATLSPFDSPYAPGWSTATPSWAAAGFARKWPHSRSSWRRSRRRRRRTSWRHRVRPGTTSWPPGASSSPSAASAAGCPHRHWPRSNVWWPRDASQSHGDHRALDAHTRSALGGRARTRTPVSQYDKLEKATKTVFECAHVAHLPTRQISPTGGASDSAVAGAAAAAVPVFRYIRYSRWRRSFLRQAARPDHGAARTVLRSSSRWRKRPGRM